MARGSIAEDTVMITTPTRPLMASILKDGVAFMSGPLAVMREAHRRQVSSGRKVRLIIGKLHREYQTV